MSALFSLVKDRINFWLLLPIVFLLAILTGMIMIDSNTFSQIQILTKILNLPQPKATIILISLLLTISACYIFLFVAYTKKPNIKDYDLINPPGFLKHRKTGKYYCQPCLLKNHIASELSPVVTENKLVCHCCDKAYNISAKIITNSYLSKAYDEAMKEIF